MRAIRNERGAAAVEFALVFPLVIMLLLTVIEFSRLWNIQATISDGARIAARYAAVHANDPSVSDLVGEAQEQARDIPGFVDWSAADIDVSVACGSAAGTVTTTISVAPGSITEWFSSALGDPIQLTAVGKMPCGG